MNNKLLSRNDFATIEAYNLYLKQQGYCPVCGMKVAGWTGDPPGGVWGFAPEWFETLRENNIDPGSGHRSNCPTLRR
jgi:hypothetical protein